MIYFMHIPKTAGSTFRAILEVNFGKAAIQKLYSREKMDAFLEQGCKKRTEVVAGHLSQDVIASFPTEGRIVTFLRDPVARVLSHYNHLSNSPDPSHRKLIEAHPTLASFATHPWGSNLQTQYVAGKDIDVRTNPEEALSAARRNLSDMAVVGLAERFDESLLLFKHRLEGFRKTAYRSENVRSYRRAEIAEADRAAIVDANASDLALYRYAVERFEADLASVPLLGAKLLVHRVGKAMANRSGG